LTRAYLARMHNSSYRESTFGCSILKAG
jgi:hypothetical protein